MTTFYQEILGVPFQETPERTALRKLVERYMAECEAYDRTVCTGEVRNGEIMPASIEQASLVNRNAQSVRKVIYEEVSRLGFTQKDFQDILIGERKIRRRS